MVKSRPIDIEISEGKSVYFASDQHFGAPNAMESKKREATFLQWLTEIEDTCEVLFLLGDLFDFWHEYKTVVPKGFVRILGKLAYLQDKGIRIIFFTGNHDLWIRDYFQEELGFEVHREKKTFNINNKKFLIAHGDGLGPGDKGYKRMKKIFTHKASQWFFRWLHPDIGVTLGNYMSRKNKLISGDEDIKFLGEDNEWLVQYAKRKLENEHFDYFVFGHRHMPLTISLSDRSTYINLGDWINYLTYAVFNNQQLTLKSYKN